MQNKMDKLHTFHWEGRNKRGIRINGEMVGVNAAIIQAELRRQSIEPLKIKKKAKSLFNSDKKINKMDVVLLTRHLSTMINAGLPIVQVIEIIAQGHEKPRMQALLTEIKTDISSGKAFADSLAKHKEVFDPLYCNLVRTAELSGTLDTMLKRIADYLEKTESLKKKIKRALTYPAAILSVAFIVASVLLLFVVPQFEKLFSSYGAQLPAFTRFVMSLSVVFQQYWYVIIGSIAGVVYAFIMVKNRNQKFHDFIDQLLLKTPVFGQLIEKAIIARIMRTLSTTLAAGIPLIDALKSVSKTSGNAVYRNAIERIRDDVETGQTLHVSMSTTHLFPNMIIQMIAVGEESGSMEQMMEKIATFYEEDVDNMISNLSSLLEPIIMVILGVIVGGFVLSMYLPIFKLGSIF